MSRTAAGLLPSMTRSRGTRTLGGMTTSVLLDAAGRRRSPATLPGHHCGRPPRNKGLRCPADPPTVEEIVAVMRCAGLTAYGLRARALIALLWRAGVRIKRGARARQSDLDRATGGVVVRSGKGGKRCEVGMDRWGWQTSHGSTTGSRCRSAPCCASSTGRPPAGHARCQRPAPCCAASPSSPALRTASASPCARGRVGVIQRQFGHANLGIT